MKSKKEKEEFTNVISIITSPFTFITNLFKNMMWCSICCCCFILLMPFIKKMLRKNDD